MGAFYEPLAMDESSSLLIPSLLCQALGGCLLRERWVPTQSFSGSTSGPSADSKEHVEGTKSGGMRCWTWSGNQVCLATKFLRYIPSVRKQVSG